jgi:hypothetical protein
MLEELIRAWGGEEVVVSLDAPSGTWMFVWSGARTTCWQGQ